MGIYKGYVVQHALYNFYIYTYTVYTVFVTIYIYSISVVVERERERTAFYRSTLPFCRALCIWNDFSKLASPYVLQMFRTPRWYGTWAGSFGRCLFLGSLEYYTIVSVGRRWWWRDGNRGDGLGFCWGLATWVVWGCSCFLFDDFCSKMADSRVC